MFILPVKFIGPLKEAKHIYGYCFGCLFVKQILFFPYQTQIFNVKIMTFRIMLIDDVWTFKVISNPHQIDYFRYYLFGVCANVLNKEEQLLYIKMLSADINKQKWFCHSRWSIMQERLQWKR